jgi:hypothetical protein
VRGRQHAGTCSPILTPELCKQSVLGCSAFPASLFQMTATAACYGSLVLAVLYAFHRTSRLISMCPFPSTKYQGPDRLILLSSAVGRIRRSGLWVKKYGDGPTMARTDIDGRPKVYLYCRSVSYSSHLSPPRPYSIVTHVREIQYACSSIAYIAEPGQRITTLHRTKGTHVHF